MSLAPALLRREEGVGRISTHGLNTLVYRVNSLKEILTTIIPHFDKYPLITQKRSDYLLFREVVMIMSRGEHVTAEGIQAIVNIRALNLGLTKVLKEAFPMYTPVARPKGEAKKKNRTSSVNSRVYFG